MIDALKAKWWHQYKDDPHIGTTPEEIRQTFAVWCQLRCDREFDVFDWGEWDVEDLETVLSGESE